MAERDDIGEDSTPLVSLVSSAVTLLTLTLAFGLLAVGWPYFWIVFPIGFGGVLPLTAGLTAWYDSQPEQTEHEATEMDTELATVRKQYASGEIDEETFERRIKRLLQTESIEDAKTFYGASESDDREETREEETA